MNEIGMNSDALREILAGNKTIETRLATARFLKLRPGDEISLREDIWTDGKFVRSHGSAAKIRVTRIDRFATFADMVEALGFAGINPSARNADEAVTRFRKFYTYEAELSSGVLAISFSLIE